MFKGFYNLTSGMLTQGRNLDTISNNMTNISTAGYKAQQFTASTFGEALISSKDKSAQEIGSETYILAPSGLETNYEQGAFDITGRALDFAIEGEGFFGIQTDDGVAYTRNGSFTLDDEGYLCLAGQGRVLDADSNEIGLSTDKIKADTDGRIYSQDGGQLGQLGLFRFEDTDALSYNDQGLYISEAQPAAAQDTAIRWGLLEASNVNMMNEMVDMMTAQRAFQSAAQMAKIYDQVASKITTDVGKL